MYRLSDLDPLTHAASCPCRECATGPVVLDCADDDCACPKCSDQDHHDLLGRLGRLRYLTDASDRQMLAIIDRAEGGDVAAVAECEAVLADIEGDNAESETDDRDEDEDAGSWRRGPQRVREWGRRGEEVSR